MTTLYEGTSQIQKLIIGRDGDRDQRDDPAARRRVSRLVETSVDGHVALCRLNRPDARNALSPELMEELADAVEGFDADPEVRCIVIAGSDEVFAAGADIDALRERTLRGGAAPSGGRVLARGSPHAGRRSSRPSRASRSAAAASWPCSAT